MLPQPSAASVVAQEKRARKRNRSRRRWLIAAGVVVLLVVFGFFGLPPIVKAQAIKHLSAELHRDVSIERIRINPLVLSVTIEGLAIKDRDGASFTSWRTLYVNFDSFSLFTGEWRFEKIHLDGFSQHVAIGKDGALNFADLIPTASAKPEPAAVEAKPSAPRPLRIASLSVTSASLNFADASRANPFATEVGPLSFELTNFLSVGDPKAPYSFSAITEAGEEFSWKGTVSVDPVRSSGEFSIGKISLKKYAPYYAEFINADLLDGLLDVTARYVVDLDEASRQLTLSDAAVKLSNLKVAARGTTIALIDLPSFTIDGLFADGLKQSATVRRIALDGGHLSVVREADGSINLLNLLIVPASTSGAALPASAPAMTPSVAAAPANPSNSTSTGSTPAALPDVRLTEFAISGLSIDIEDKTTPTPAKNSISRFDFTLNNLSLANPAEPVLVALAVATSPGGSIAVDGSIVREPLTAFLNVKIAALPLAGATPYIEPLLNVRIASGQISVDGRASVRGSVAGFLGDVVIDKFATVDGANAEEFASFKQLAIRGIDASSEPLTARIAEINLVDPAARIAINADKTSNLATVLRSVPEPSPVPGAAVSLPSPSATTAPRTFEAASGPAAIWSLGKFTLTNGAVTLADRSVKPAVRLSLDQFSGTIAGLSSADLQRADVDIRGKVNGTGEIAFTGKLDAKAATPAAGALTELVVSVKDVDLSPISPYVGTYAGYELARSGLSVEVKARLAQRKIDSSNVVTLKQFTFGAPTQSPEATKLPVRLGVALLKDTNGNIIIDMPVQGSLDDPNFRIGRVVLRVIVNLLAKAATSPFSLIGAAFGGGGDELAYQEFSPGEIAPLGVELKKIDTLKKALKGRPSLNLDINGSYDAATDLVAVRERSLAKQVRQRLWEELRVKNPDTPPPAELVVSSEDEARVIGLLFVERFPAGMPVAPAPESVDNAVVAETTVEPLAPVKSRGPVLRRNQRVFTNNTNTPVAAAPTVKSVAVLSSRGVESAASPNGAAPIMLADARGALISGITVSDEELRELANARALYVRDALLAGGEIEAGRLFLTAPAPEGKGARVFLQLR
ncbi:MAG: DUF748 domain-containing protein [Rariglobus sp.]